MDRGILYFHISNSYEGKTQKAVLNGREVYITRKEDKQRHGLGWQSIIRVVEKYHGMVETDDTGGKFAVDIMLYLILIFNKTIESFYCAASCGTSGKAAENVVQYYLYRRRRHGALRRNKNIFKYFY